YYEGGPDAAEEEVVAVVPEAFHELGAHDETEHHAERDRERVDCHRRAPTEREGEVGERGQNANTQGGKEFGEGTEGDQQRSEDHDPDEARDPDVHQAGSAVAVRKAPESRLGEDQ